jgi:hypothetical protein
VALVFLGIALTPVSKWDMMIQVWQRLLHRNRASIRLMIFA